MKIDKFIKNNVETIIFAAIASAITIFIFCGFYQYATQIKEGIVIRKDYTPEYTTTDYQYIYHNDGTTTRVPIQKHHAARYCITIKGINDKGEEKFGYYDVTPAEYEQIKIGDYYIKQMQEGQK